MYEYLLLTCEGDLANLLVLFSCPHLSQEHFLDAEGKEGKLHRGTVFRSTVGRNYPRPTTHIPFLPEDVLFLAADPLIALLLSVGVMKKSSFGSVSTKNIGDLEEHVFYSE